MTTASTSTNALLPDWQALLQGWALDGSLAQAAQEALMLEGTPDALQDLINQWSAEDFRSLPPIVLLSSAEMNGAMGAYAISTGTIYLNADWMATATQDQINAVLTEELGHHLDGLLNLADTPGDEGEYFARLLSGETISHQAIAQIQKQGDWGTVQVGGILVSAEFAATIAIQGNSLYTTVDGPSWSDAQANAIALGGNLIIINNASENEFVSNAFKDDQSLQRPGVIVKDVRAWFGLTPTSQDNWKWIDNSTPSYFNWVDSQIAANGIIASNDGGITSSQNSGEIGQVWNIYVSYDLNNIGRWENGTPAPELRGIAEIPLNLSFTRAGTVIEGGGLFTTSINLSAGTTTNLANGTTVYWSISGISADDLASGSLSGSGVIADGKLDIRHSLKVDDSFEAENFIVNVYSDPTLRTSGYQIGSSFSVFIEDFRIGTLSTNDRSIYISGTAGSAGTSKIESYSVVRTVTGSGKNRIVTDTPTYTPLATYSNPGVDGITYSGGASANTISAAGVAGDPMRTAFNGQTILDGQLGVVSHHVDQQSSSLRRC